MCRVQPNRWVSEHVRLKKPHAQTTQLATTATTAMSHDDAMMQRCDQNVTPATIATTAM